MSDHITPCIWQTALHPYTSQHSSRCLKGLSCNCAECPEKVRFSEIKTLYATFKDLSHEFLVEQIKMSVLTGYYPEGCHNLSWLMQAYYTTVDDSCKYRGEAFRWTTKGKKPARGFNNFSKSPDAYNGPFILVRGQCKNFLWRALIEGVDIEKLMSVYDLDSAEADPYGLAAKEQLIIGTPVEEPQPVQLRKLKKC